MTARLFCMPLVFTVALSCDDSVSTQDTPYRDTYDKVGLPAVPDELAGTESGEPDMVSQNGQSDTKNSFCLPLEIMYCYSSMSKAVAKCPSADCHCHTRVTYFEAVGQLSACVNAACPAHYPDQERYTSCYRDWYTDNRSCLESRPCTDWSTESCGGGQVGLFRSLQSCMGT